MSVPMTKKPIDKSMIQRLRTIPKYLGDKTVPLWKKLAITVGTVYILSPVDALPELVLPAIGWLDDLGLLAIMIAWLMHEIDVYAAKVKSGGTPAAP